MRNQMVLAASAAIALGACVGGFEQPNGDDDDGGDPKQQFDQRIAPMLTTKCAACHVGPETSPTNMFLGPDGLSSYYTTITNDRAVVGGFSPAAATLLSKGVHEGPAWTDAEKAKISDWLLAEQEARGVDTGPIDPSSPNKTARGAMMAFAACLSVSEAEFTATGAVQIANLNTRNNGRCSSCHTGGAGGEYLDNANNGLIMLARWQEEVFFTGTFQAAIQPDNSFRITAAESKICAKGNEKDNNLGTHPEFNCNDGTALANLKTFTTQVNQKLDAGGCPAPAFKSPPVAP